MSGGPVMRMRKLFFGVLRVLTPLGPLYLTPSLAERLYLLWIFRNFETLPIRVLSPRQQRRMEAMCARQGFVSVLEANGLLDTPLLGTLSSARQSPHRDGLIEASPMLRHRTRWNPVAMRTSAATKRSAAAESGVLDVILLISDGTPCCRSAISVIPTGCAVRSQDKRGRIRCWKDRRKR